MKKFYSILMAQAVLVSSLSAVSCTEDIEIDRVNEDDYANVTSLIGTLRDANSNKVSTIVEMFHDTYNTNVAFTLSRAPKAGVDVKVEYDAEYVAQYNNEHGTDFLAWPQDRFSIQNDGKIVVAPDEKVSYKLGVEIAKADTTELVAEATYILPLKAVVSGGDVQLSESRCVYLLKNRSGEGTAMRKPGEKGTVLFFEVNDTNPLNALQFQMEDGRYLWNYVVLFAANINYDREKGEVYVFCNPQVQYILDHNEEIIQPLRRRGIKVIISILGNHDESGLAQLSDLGARQFAQAVKNLCEAYNLDGVNYDDEYSNSPDLSNPLFTQRSREAGSRLIFETKKAMPDKEIISYQYGSCVGQDYVDGIPSNEWLDIVVGDYGRAGVPYAGMTLANCSANSFEMARGGSISLSQAQGYANSEYGYVMAFGLWAANKQGNQSQFNSMNNLAQGLYGSPLKKPEYYWPSSKSMETKPINW
ncbi:MAG: BT_3987 domain-containing protein [Candidatus Cryptobacteroides sp.]